MRHMSTAAAVTTLSPRIVDTPTTTTIDRASIASRLRAQRLHHHEWRDVNVHSNDTVHDTIVTSNDSNNAVMTRTPTSTTQYTSTIESTTTTTNGVDGTIALVTTAKSTTLSDRGTDDDLHNGLQKQISALLNRRRNGTADDVEHGGSTKSWFQVRYTNIHLLHIVCR